ncbi:MAG: tryptophan synthase subunit beta [Thermoflexales bacterium]|nr:tryptophan synthase subunit beta [Thermoflexales bacterium]
MPAIVDADLKTRPPSETRSPWPDDAGKFGPYGGRFVPETLMPALDDVIDAWQEFRNDAAFRAEYEGLLSTYVGRPTPVSHAKRLSATLGGAQIYLKREDLTHTGAHKINNALGQALLARRMGKTRIIAETGAGQHGVATATACALLGMECIVYMGVVDMARQQPNVFRMRLLGAEVRGVTSGTRTLKDAVNEAIRDWVTNIRDTYYVIGSALGPHPYPLMCREFQSVIGLEAREQIQGLAGRLPDAVIACVGGGSNAIGIFHPFLDDPVQLIGVEAGGYGPETGKHAARFAAAPASTGVSGKTGVFQGMRTVVLQNADGQIAETHSISAGLDYAGIGPEHALLRDLRRVEYVHANDADALAAFQALCRFEGIIPALESSHAVAEAIRRAPSMRPDQILLVNLSGRGDKDLNTVLKALGMEGDPS